MAARLMSAASSAPVSRPTICPTAARAASMPSVSSASATAPTWSFKLRWAMSALAAAPIRTRLKGDGHQAVHGRSDQQAHNGGNHEHEEQRADAGGATPRERKCG